MISRMILTAATLLSAIAIHAQEFDTKNRSLVFKFTETWCVPCGDWGWDIAEDVISDIGDQGYYIGVMGSSSPASMNANCYNALASNFNIEGYPEFFVNNVRGIAHPYDLFAELKALYSENYSSHAVVSPAAVFTVSGGTINVDAKAKFWEPVTGAYYMAAYILENKVMAEQASRSGVSEHHYLLRGTMSADLSPWGQLLADGPVPASAIYNKSFSMPVDPAWNTDEISVLVVIYKKEGSVYNAINSKTAVDGSSLSHKDNRGDMVNLSVYPNPASGDIQLRVRLGTTGNFVIKAIDVTGRTNILTPLKEYVSGDNDVRIPTDALNNGVYQIVLEGEGLISSSSIIISR